ncbi:hypothetical protein [Plantactinospora sp. CA-290183]|uniref:hypothetical protein n=1 Tax=Plantactinospora sp. CA-290183 TaxID=3240006 RepID=UPI003D928B49
MPARRLGRLVGSVLLLAVLAIGSYAASAGGLAESGQRWVADSAAPVTVAPPPATDGVVVAGDWSWV